jgi:2-methylisocitrate lyase-like PEP mutase family enzyme
MAGRKVVTTDEMVARLQAGLGARRTPDFVIIARTDAKAEHGLGEVIERLNVYFAVGADLAMLAEPFTVAKLRRLCAEINGPLALVGGNAEWPESMLSRDEFDELDVKLVLYAVTGLGVALKAQMAVYGDLLANGRLASASANALMPLESLNELMGLSEWNEIEAAALKTRN